VIKFAARGCCKDAIFVGLKELGLGNNIMNLLLSYASSQQSCYSTSLSQIQSSHCGIPAQILGLTPNHRSTLVGRMVRQGIYSAKYTTRTFLYIIVPSRTFLTPIASDLRTSYEFGCNSTRFQPPDCMVSKYSASREILVSSTSPKMLGLLTTPDSFVLVVLGT
jgi:hypothetical protein